MVLANDKRKLRIPPHTFRESSFEYLGETIQLWSLKEYFKVDKWREDAIRKSRRNAEAREIERLIQRKQLGKGEMKEGGGEWEIYECGWN